MKYIAEFEVMVIEPDAPKGEELDKAVEDAVNQMDVEGCEINDTKTEVERAADKAGNARLEAHKSAARCIRQVIVLHESFLDKPWEGNPKYTNREMIMFWCDMMEDKPRP